MTAAQPVGPERIVITADGVELCIECGEMLYHGLACCSVCDRRAASGLQALGATHKDCGGVFRAWDAQRDPIVRRVLRADAAPVECSMCDALIGGA